MRAVNLLPLDARYQKKWWAADAVPATPRRIFALGAIVAGVLVLSLIGAYLLAHSTVKDRQETLAALQERTVSAEAAAAKIRAEQESAQARLTAFTNITSTRIAWEKVFRDISRVLPPHAFLQSMSVATSAPAAPTSATPSGTFNVTGTTSSQPAVALVLDRLALLPFLFGVSLQSSARGENAVNFTIAATFAPEGGTP